MSKEGAVKAFGIFFIVRSILTLLGAAIGALLFGLMYAFTGDKSTPIWLLGSTTLVSFLAGGWLLYAGILVIKRKRSAQMEVMIAAGIYIISNLSSPVLGMIGLGSMGMGSFMSFGMFGWAFSGIGIAFWGFIMWYFNQPSVKSVLNK